MAKDNRINMPSTTGGLIRYFDDYKSKLVFKPGHIIILIIIIIILEIILKLKGVAIFGV